MKTKGQEDYHFWFYMNWTIPKYWNMNRYISIDKMYVAILTVTIFYQQNLINFIYNRYDIIMREQNWTFN